MDKLRLLLCLAVMAACALQACFGEDKGKHVLEGGPIDGKKVKKGCVVGIVRPCNISNLNLTCRQPLRDPENGGTPCPAQVELADLSKPAEIGQPCVVGPWDSCRPLKDHPDILVRSREPVDVTANLITCPHLIEECTGPSRLDCIMTTWSRWYTYGDADEIKLRVRFILIPPENGGTPCPHDVEACIYDWWSRWFPYANGCYRVRTAIGYPTGTVCYPEYGLKSAPCNECEPWGPWTAWQYDEGSNPCRDTRTRTSTGCSRTDSESRPCICVPWGGWEHWYRISGSPCTDRRVRTSPRCPHTPNSETRTCPCQPWGPWGGWSRITTSPCTDRRNRTSPTCPTTHNYETRSCPCQPWGPWGGWSRITTSPCTDRRNRTSPTCPTTHNYETRSCPCRPWGPWGGWSRISTSPCTDRRNRTSPTCPTIHNYETRSCIFCPYGQWSEWSLHTVFPCKQRRHRNGPPCPPGIMTQERDCVSACPPPPPDDIVDSGAPLEAFAGTRRKRDVPWCPEAKWVIYGRSDNCMAVNNATWYKCDSLMCENCNPPAGSSLICVQNKYAKLAVPLVCQDGRTDVMTVTRSMACTCHAVRNTCDKFQGPCAP